MRQHDCDMVLTVSVILLFILLMILFMTVFLNNHPCEIPRCCITWNGFPINIPISTINVLNDLYNVLSVIVGLKCFV